MANDELTFVVRAVDMAVSYGVYVPAWGADSQDASFARLNDAEVAARNLHDGSGEVIVEKSEVVELGDGWRAVRETVVLRLPKTVR